MKAELVRAKLSFECWSLCGSLKEFQYGLGGYIFILDLNEGYCWNFLLVIIHASTLLNTEVFPMPEARPFRD